MVSLTPMCPVCGSAPNADGSHVCRDVAVRKPLGFDWPKPPITRSPEALTAGWITTFTGRRVYPLRMSADQIDLLDLAHHLSMRVRYSGAVRNFYSVAEHSILMARYLIENMEVLPNRNMLAKWALMHDASEAYLPDISAPIKPILNGFKVFENLILVCIGERFSLPVFSVERPEGPSVKEIDLRIRIDEAAALLNQGDRRKPTDGFDYGHPLDVRIEAWLPDEAERRFLECAELLEIK